MRTLRMISWTLLVSTVLGAGCSASTEHIEDKAPLAQSQSRLNASIPGKGPGVLWRKANGELVVWDMASATDYKEFTIGAADLSWQPLGTGDFNADGHGDVLWLRRASRELSLWTLRDTRFNGSTAGTPNWPGSSYPPFLVDEDGDRVTDIVWPTVIPVNTGQPVSLSIYQRHFWWMRANSTTPRATADGTSQIDAIVAMGNFDGDGSNRADILWRAEGGDFRTKVSLNGGAPSAPFAQASRDWVVKGVGDFNNDGKSDVLWFNKVTGDVQYWPMNGANPLSGIAVGVPIPDSTGWKIQGVADVDHDGISDILWRHTNGDFSAWTMTAAGVKAYGDVITVPTSTVFVGVLDLALPPAPTNPVVSVFKDAAGRGPNTLLQIDFDVPPGRPNDSVIVREPPGMTRPGTGPFPMKVAYTSIAPTRARITLDAAKFGNRDRASMQIAQWQQGRQSAFSGTFSAPGLPAPPAAPTQMTIVRSPRGREFEGCSFEFSSLCLTLSHKDNTPPNTVPNCELWMKTGFNGQFALKDFNCGVGPSGGTMTREDTSAYLGNDRLVCFKMRNWNNGGFSEFSNVACTSGVTPPTVPATLGLREGVVMCDSANSTCNFMARVNQPFRLRWQVCNAGTVHSAAVNVQLHRQTNHRLGNLLQSFPISGGVPPLQCVLQETELINVDAVSDWHWDVLINGGLAGGLGWSFWN